MTRPGLARRCLRAAACLTGSAVVVAALALWVLLGASRGGDFEGCPMWWIEVLLAASLIVAALAMIADTRGTL
jgi:hypothetical protein